MSIEIPFKRLSDADELLPFDCGDEDLNIFPPFFCHAKKNHAFAASKFKEGK